MFRRFQFYPVLLFLLLPDVTVKSEKLSDTTVESEKLLDMTVKPEKSLGMTVKPEKSLGMTVEPEKLLDTTVKSEKLLDTTVKSEKLLDMTVKSEKLLDTTEKSEKLLDTTVKSETLWDTTEAIDSQYLDDIEIAKNRIESLPYGSPCSEEVLMDHYQYIFAACARNRRRGWDKNLCVMYLENFYADGYRLCTYETFCKSSLCVCFDPRTQFNGTNCVYQSEAECTNDFDMKCELGGQCLHQVTNGTFLNCTEEIDAVCEARKINNTMKRSEPCCTCKNGGTTLVNPAVFVIWIIAALILILSYSKNDACK